MANIDRNVSGAAVELALNGTMASGTPTDGQTFVLNGDVTGWPTTFGVVLLDPDGTQEKILYSVRSGNTFTVATSGRGFDGTAATNHGNNAKAVHFLDADLVNRLIAHVNNTLLDHHTQYLNVARHDVTARHAVGAVLPPGTPVALVPGTANAQGSGTTVARADHVHQVPTAAPVSLVLGGVNTEGSAGTFARSDHLHQLTPASVLPPGLIMLWSTLVAPGGWLICDGTAVSRTVQAALFAAIGTSYGIGDGSTTFNLPNCKGRVPVGYDSTQTEFNTLGETGGEKAHILVSAELAAHVHAVDPPNTVTDTQGNHYHVSPNGQNFVTQGGPASIGLSVSAGGAAVASTDWGGPHAHNLDIPSFNSGNVGAGTAHNNLQPYLALPYIIKT